MVTNNRRKPTIAIADDHVMMRDMLCSILSEHNEIAIAVGSGKELLSFLSSGNQAPDLCIVDISMPGLKGYDVVKIILEQWPDMKILAQSFGELPDDLYRMISAGAHGFISKTDTPESWEFAVKSLMDGEYCFNKWAMNAIINKLSSYY